MEEGITRVNATRRRYSAEFKAQMLRECAEPGASVAGTALAHGVNANLVHKWRRRVSSARAAGAANVATADFIPIALQRPAQASPIPDASAGQPATQALPIRVNVQRGAVRVQVSWPVQAAGDCAAWLMELTR